MKVLGFRIWSGIGFKGMKNLCYWWKKKSVMFRSQNDYVELGEKVFWCSRHRTPATLFFTDQMLGLLNYKSEELKICPSKKVISDYKISLHIMLFIPLKRFSLSITVSVKKCFWRWCLDVIINIIIMNFHNWKMTEVLHSPTETRNYHHCLKIYILYQKARAFFATFFPRLCPLTRYDLWKTGKSREEAKYRKAVKSELPSPLSPSGDQSISSRIYLGFWDNGEYHTASAFSADNYHSPLLSICRCQNRYCANRSFRNAGRQTVRIWHYLSAVSHFKTRKV